MWQLKKKLWLGSRLSLGATAEFVIMGFFYGLSIGEHDFRMNSNLWDITDLRIKFTLRVIWIVTHGLKEKVFLQLLY